MVRAIFLAVSATLLSASTLLAQARVPDPTPIDVFLDCQANSCDSQHFRTEIGFVSWVRDRTAADVHLLITSQSTGGGGVLYELSFFGLGPSAADTLQLGLTMAQSATSTERRDALTNRIAQGLLYFAIHTTAAERVAVKHPAGSGDDEEGTPGAPVTGAVDPWKHWVFSAGVEASADGEQRQASHDFEVQLAASRVTEIWNYQMRAEGSFRENRYDLGERRLVVTRRNYSANMQLTKALADLWSAGLQASAGTSTFRNQDLYLRVAPVLEYSFFPYTEFSRRRITLQYSVGLNHFDYTNETLFDKTEEQVADERLELAIRYQQPWGSSRLTLEGGHYFHDLSRYSLGAFGGLDVRLLKGLSFEMNASYSRVHDQLFIQKGDASDEDVLTERLALATGYEYDVGVGLRYTFGSIFNNIINRRIN
jgi:hypothetical protein